MKLFTEEQLLKSVAFGVKFCKNDELPSGYTAVQYVDSLTPIELPSDEEIDKAIFPYMDALAKAGFIEGAKWVIDKIKNQ